MVSKHLFLSLYACSFFPSHEASLLKCLQHPEQLSLSKANQQYDLSKKACREFLKLPCTTGPVHPTPSQAFIFQMTCSHAAGLAINT